MARTRKDYDRWGTPKARWKKKPTGKTKKVKRA